MSKRNKEREIDGVLLAEWRDAVRRLRIRIVLLPLVLGGFFATILILSRLPEALLFFEILGFFLGLLTLLLTAGNLVAAQIALDSCKCPGCAREIPSIVSRARAVLDDRWRCPRCGWRDST